MNDETNIAVPGGTWQPRRAAPMGELARPGRALGHRMDGATGEDGSRFNVNELLRVLAKWKWMILGAFAAGTLIALVVTLLMTPIYRATTTIEINSAPSDVAGRQTEARDQTGDPDQFLHTQYGLLQSRALADRVARSLNLLADDDFASGASRNARAQSAAARIQRNLEVLPQPSSNLIQLAYSDPDAARATRVVNAIANGYISSNLERRYNATAFARRFLQTRLAAIRARLEESERQVVEYARNKGIVQLNTAPGAPSGDTLSSQSLTALNQALAEATAARIAAQQQYRVSSGGETQQVLGNATVQQLRTDRAQLQAEYDQKLATFKPGLPEMIALRSRLQSIDRSVALARQSVQGTLRSSYAEAVGRESQLRGQVAALRGDVLDLRSRGIQYNILQRDLDTNRTLYDALLQRYKEIGVAGGVGESQAAIVDPAIRPGAPYSPNAPLNLAIGAALGLLLGLGAAFAIEFLDDTIKTPEDVLDKLRTPLLGLVPRIGRNSSVPQELADQRSEVSESYVAIMTTLQFATVNGMPRTILVSSSREAEGKTSTSLALAQNFARIGASVLLIDADLRKPSFRAGNTEGRGLSSLLTNAEPLIDHVVQTFVENLSLLPGGTIPPNPAELLSTGRIKHLLAEAAEQFDVVIVDAPPVLGLADAPVLASLCEATVMIVQSGMPRRPVLNSLRRLMEANAAVTGVVLTKYNVKEAGQGYGYGYAYGYGQRYGENAGSRPLIELAA